MDPITGRESGDVGSRADEGWTAKPVVPLIAHQLLASMGSIRSVVRALADRGDSVTAAERARLLGLVDRRAEQVSAVLRDLVLGLPAEALQALGRQRADRMERAEADRVERAEIERAEIERSEGS